MKAILVTGGGSGIGRATATLFSAKGWRVGLADVNAAGLAATAATLPADRTTTHTMDVRDRNDWVRTLSDFIAASGGRLDVLFNNAGIASGGPFAEMDPATLDRVIDVNFRGVAYGALFAHRHLKATREREGAACLLNTASASAIYGSAGLATYSATKFAVRALTEALDAEWAPDGITVRDLMPGFIDTPLLDFAMPGSNRTARDNVAEAGLEFTPVEAVAQAAWDAVHGKRLHTLVGPTAKKLAFAARWMPARLGKRMRDASFARGR